MIDITAKGQLTEQNMEIKSGDKYVHNYLETIHRWVVKLLLRPGPIKQVRLNYTW